MSKFVKQNLSQLVATLDRCISSCDEEHDHLTEKLKENGIQRDSYVENRNLAAALLTILDERDSQSSDTDK